MTAERETVRALRTLFEDDVTVLPDRIFDAVLADLPVTRQERPLLGRGARLGRSRAAMAFALVAVAVVAFAVGFSLYGGFGGRNVGAPIPSTSPSPSASASSAVARPIPTAKPGTGTPPAGWPTPQVLVPESPLPSPSGSALPADLIGRQYVSVPMNTQGFQAEVLTLRAADDPHCAAMYGGSSTCFTILWTPNYPKHIDDPAVRGSARIVNGNLVLRWMLVPFDPNCEGQSFTYLISTDAGPLTGPTTMVSDCANQRYVRF